MHRMSCLYIFLGKWYAQQPITYYSYQHNIYRSPSKTQVCFWWACCIYDRGKLHFQFDVWSARDTCYVAQIKNDIWRNLPNTRHVILRTSRMVLHKFVNSNPWIMVVWLVLLEIPFKIACVCNAHVDFQRLNLSYTGGRWWRPCKVGRGACNHYKWHNSSMALC